MVTVPNKITLARIAAIPFFIAALFYRRDVAALIFAIIASSDVVDGWVARRRKETSIAGAILDPLADKLLVGAALIFLIDKGVDAWMAFVIIAREFLVTGLRLLAPNEKIITASWLGKLKTLSQNIAVLMVLLNVAGSWYGLLIAMILTVVSGLDYFYRAWATVKKEL